MTDPDQPPLLEHEAAPTPPPEPPAEATPPARRRAALAVLLLAGAAVLIGGGAYLWQQTMPSGPSSASPATADAGVSIAGLQARLDALQHRLDLQPPPPPPPAPSPPVDLAPLEARLQALEARPAAPPPAPGVDLAPLTAKLDALAAAQDKLAAGLHESEASLAQRLDADEGRLTAVERADSQQAGAMTALAARATGLARVQAAAVALATGQPLGALPGAPPALARFASTPPPTEAALRLGFPAAARAAEADMAPDTSGLDLWHAMASRVEGLVTVRRGSEVVIGNPLAGMIEQARQAVEAGDLAAAVAALGNLKGSGAQPLVAWRTQAAALLDARAALAQLAARLAGQS